MYVVVTLCNTTEKLFEENEFPENDVGMNPKICYICIEFLF